MIERAEKVARRLEQRRWPRAEAKSVEAAELRDTEDYKRRLETIQAVREAARWVRPASLEVSRVTMTPTSKTVYPEFEDWQLALAIESLERRGTGLHY
jgi:hypothetical protein